MIHNIYGIKEFQKQLPAIAKKIAEVGGYSVVTNRSKPVFVTIPFEEYKEIEDILLELTNKKLAKDVSQTRKEYQQNKSRNFEDFVKEA
jgi:PHD/YefM family antitoxin component YafN of YafNO toxin-antitoxin module